MKDILLGLFHLFASYFIFSCSASMVLPAITDVTMEAICPGQDNCSLAVYLSAFQQAITGVGTLFVTPLVGNLSDRYGRKALLTLPMIAAIFPLGILAYDRSRTYFYAYYATGTVTSMFCWGSMQSISLAYVADKVCPQRRVIAFGILTGISTVGFLTGTVVGRFVPTSYIFLVSTIVAVFAAVYMGIFLEETDLGATIAIAVDDEATKPLCSSMTDGESSPRLPTHRKMPSLNDMVSLLRSSCNLSQAAIIQFFSSLAESGLTSALFYFLKAQFQFEKDEFADLMLITGVAGVFSQLFLMPSLAPSFGEEKLLSIGLLASFAHILLYSIAWSHWVPYLSAVVFIFSIFVTPCIQSIVSKRVGPTEQGMAQGCITSIGSFANILSPLIFSPLTACFLSETAPFHFKGFSILCAGFGALIGFVLSITMLEAAPTTWQKV